jgi:hypothetical protein
VPKMIEWFKNGQFAVDKIVKFYPVSLDSVMPTDVSLTVQTTGRGI